MKTNYLLIYLFIFPIFLLAQEEEVTVQNGDWRATFSSTGFQGLASDDQAILQYESSENSVHSIIANTGLWVGAKRFDGSIFVHHPGLNTEEYIDPIYKKVFRVTAEEIHAHRQDFEENYIINDPIPAIYAWPGAGNPHFDGEIDDPDIFFQDLNTAPFFDRNGDGVYNPDDGDYPSLPCISPDQGWITFTMPTEMNWCLFQIKDPKNEEVVLQVTANLYYFRCDSNMNIGRSMFVNYHWQQVSQLPYNEMYVGVVISPSIGEPQNDFVGSLPDNSAVYAYNATNNDSDFAQAPPATGVAVVETSQNSALGATPSSIVHFYEGDNGDFAEATLAPSTPEEYYNLLSGKWKDGSPITEGGIGYETGGDTTQFAFPGLPDDNNSWTEWQAGNPAGKRNILINYGLFNFEPSFIRTTRVAYLLNDSEGSHLNKAHALANQVEIAYNYHSSCYNPFTIDCQNVSTSVQSESNLALEWNVFPNPVRDHLEVRCSFPVDGIELFNYQGQLLLQSRKTELNVGHLPKGIYYLRVQSEGKHDWKKVVLQ